jgi:hypothetical protein
MSKVERTVDVPAKKLTVVDHIVCELCGKKSNKEGKWADTHYDVSEVDVSFTSGYSYPEDTCTTTIVLDICNECFASKLIPWFVSQGGQTRKE